MIQFKPNDNRFLWDFWFLDYSGKEQLKLYYLTAPNTSDPELRHLKANIAYAEQQHDGSWQDFGPIFKPDIDPQAWDSQATWTGSTVKLKHNLLGYQYIMAYTGISITQKASMQRTSFALSHDGIHWVRDLRMAILEADPKHHRMNNQNWNNETAFRDPYLLPLDDGRYALFVTTERIDAPEHACASVSVYLSEDLLQWKLQSEPVTPITPFGQMEVATPFYWQGRWYLIINCPKQLIADNTQGIPKLSGAFYFTALDALGPYKYGGVLLAHNQERVFNYTPKVVVFEDHLELYAWRGYQEDGSFGGYLEGPIRIEKENDNLVIKV